MGGNGPWKQRYVVKIGNSHYITPVQYNEATGTWSNYHGEHTTANGPTAPKNSWERRCGACHATGILLSFDQASGEYLTGYAQLNIGCEACHGPGAAHVASRDEDDILNPRDLMDGTAEGVQAADLTCGQCHHRGGGGTPAGAPSGTGYPWNAGVGIFPPGGSEADFAGFYTTSSGIFFLEKTNPFPGVAKTHNASRQHHQQYLDLHNGPHAPNKGYDGACFDCHDAHASRADRPQMMATTITRGGVTYTDVEDRNNKLCLACHKGHGDFAAVTPTDVESITDTFAPARVVTAVRDHMSDKAAMPVGAASYTPAQDGTGRCSTCHMPYMSKSADYTLDRAGNAVGDVKSHMFWPVCPNTSKKAASTNSCNGCHPIGAADVTGPVIEAWAQDHDADGTFHADTPRSFQTGVAHAESAGGGMACASCHTTKGFIEAQVYGGQAALIASQADRDALVLDSITFDKGITCEACHGKQGDGTFAAGANPLRFPAADLCGKCHMNETIQFADYRDHGEIVRHPQQQMMDGVEAGEVPGREAQYQNSFHASLSCVDCHFALGEASNHSFAPRFASCTAAGCHQNQGLSDFNRIARADYDGDGTTEGVQDEVRGVRAILEAEILTTVTSTGAVITFDGSYFLIDGNRSNTAALNAVADAALMRAMFNHYWSRYEGSDGVHNTAYALQILQKSYEELTGSGWTVGTGGGTR